jgi:uncharacterized membrane protein
VRVAAGTYLVGSLVCHQRPERTFHLEGVQLPVCARCTGLYFGATVGLLAGLGWRRRLQARGARDWRPWIVAAAAPTALTLGLELAGLWAPANAVRALAGVPLGAAVGLLLAGMPDFRSRL